MTKLARQIMADADYIAVKKNKVSEVNEKLKSFRSKPGNLDLMTMCELESIIGEQLFTIPPPLTKQQLRKKKLEQLNKICERDNTVWVTYDPNDESNQWYRFA